MGILRSHTPVIVLAALALATTTPPTVFAESPATAGNRASEAREYIEELRRISAALRDTAQTNPALAAHSNDLARISDLAGDALAQLGEAEIQAAEAWVEMACYAAWIVARESKKKTASLRLIEITRATGKADEVERYEARHEMLLASIHDAMERYEAILLELGSLPEKAIERGFALYAEELAERERPVRAEILEAVREHLAEAAEGGDDLAESWQRKLETL